MLVLSHGLWQRRWGGDLDVVGRTLTLNGEQFTVVGVMPPGFHAPEALGHGAVEMWFPLAFANWDLTSRNNWFLQLVARLEPSTTIEAARQQITYDWWHNERQHYELCISEIVLDEAAAGDSEAATRRLAFLQPLPLLDLTGTVNVVAKAIMASGLLPEQAARDAVHIAVSPVHSIDILLTWN